MAATRFIEGQREGYEENAERWFWLHLHLHTRAIRSPLDCTSSMSDEMQTASSKCATYNLATERKHESIGYPKNGPIQTPASMMHAETRSLAYPISAPESTPPR